MRLFVGIFPDEGLKKHLRSVISDLQGFNKYLRFVPIDQIHLTVKFLGNDISDDTYLEYASQLEKKLEAFSEFEIIPAELSFGFKYQLRPKVLILNVDENPILEELTQAATDAAKSINPRDIISKKEHKKLIHHITVGRPKRVPSKSESNRIKEKISTLGIYTQPFKANNISLIQSILTSHGPIYKVVKNYPLKTLSD